MGKQKDASKPDVKKDDHGIQYIGANKVLLPEEFVQELYDSCTEGPSRPVILAELSRAGFDIDQVGFCLDENLYAEFINKGRPTAGLTLTYRTASPRKAEKPDEGSGNTMSLEELVATGKFCFKGGGIMFSPDFEEALFQAYPGQSIEDGLRLAGIDPASVGQNRINRLEKRFRARIDKKAENPTESAPVDETEAASASTSNNAAGNGRDNGTGQMDHQMTDEELIDTGLFIMTPGGLSFEPGFEKRLYEAYPGHTIEAGLQEAGLSLENIGKPRIYRLKHKFKVLGGRDILFMTRKNGFTDRWVFRKEIIEKYSAHPFVKAATEEEILLQERFFQEAAFLQILPMEEILQIYGIEPGLFTRDQRVLMGDILKKTPLTVSADPGLAEMESYKDLSLQILYNRMKGLEKAVDKELAELSGEISKMKASERRDLFQYLVSLPKDPGGKFCTSYFINALGVSRNSFYSMAKSKDDGSITLTREEKEEQEAAMVRRVFEYKGYAKGARQIYMLLPELEGKHISLKRVKKIMEEEGLHCGVRDPNPSRKTGRLIKSRVKPDLLKRRFRLFRPNQVKVSDVTYLTIKDGARAYGSAALDPVTSKVICFNISERNDMDLVKETLRLSREDPSFQGGIFHTDEGSLYLSPEFQKEIEKKGFVLSMSKRGNSQDNAPIESFWGHFKDEVKLGSLTYHELSITLPDYVEYYNGTRRLWYREHMTPLEYEAYLTGMTDEEFQDYLDRETEKYQEMKKNAARKAVERAKTLGVDGIYVEGEADE